MILIVGLGNPGKEYDFTRHNIGFEIINSLQNNFNFPVFRNKFDGLYSKKTFFGENVVIFKPQTFMNLSGSPIKKMRDYYKVDNSNNLILIHDDLDMDFLKIRVKSKGGHGGHNGVKDVIKFNGQDFYRIKIGIKNHFFLSKKIKPEFFVLDKFDIDERKKIEEFKKLLIENFEYIVKKKFSLLNIN